jgi:predicted nucleic acid-binding protein
VRKLTALIERDDAEVFASNQVIGEAYIALQHHYGVPKPDARAALASVLKSGLVAPLNGAGVFAALEADAGCGLLDRLIADDYRRAELTTLTLDRKMAALPQVRRL